MFWSNQDRWTFPLVALSFLSKRVSLSNALKHMFKTNLSETFWLNVFTGLTKAEQLKSKFSITKENMIKLCQCLRHFITNRQNSPKYRFAYYLNRYSCWPLISPFFCFEISKKKQKKKTGENSSKNQKKMSLNRGF